MKSLNKNYWKTYWSDKKNGQHRFQTKRFLFQEAKEKIFLLHGGSSLFDMGCGSADLLVYYIPYYELCVGADWSASMLESARRNIENNNTSRMIDLIQTDDSEVWDCLNKRFGKDFRFDRITAGQLIQYLNKEQIDFFIQNAVQFLSDDGKLCLFDIVNSATSELWEAGLFRKEKFTCGIAFKVLKNRIKGLVRHFLGKPAYRLYYQYPPTYFMKKAKTYGLRATIVYSMYYEYRYHVIFEKK